MSAADNLDELTNDQLRLRLMEYGFANVPVTSTTRKVLIKKLRNAIVSATAKNRRETIAVTKYSSDEESRDEQRKTAATDKKRAGSENRRATVDATHAAPITTRRRSRATPVPILPLADHTAPTVPDDILEVSDEDEPPVTRIIRKKSKSPITLKKNATEDRRPRVIEHPIVEISESIDESKAARRRTKLPTPQPIEKNLYPTLDVDDVEPPGNYNSYSAPTASRYSSATTYRAETGDSWTSPQTNWTNRLSYLGKLTPQPDQYENDNDEDLDDDNDENLDDPIEAPFLSEFTRRLAELKAEKLTVDGDKVDGTVNKNFRRTFGGQSTYPPFGASQYGSSIYSRRTLPSQYRNEVNTAGGSSMWQSLKALEHQYRWLLLTAFGIVSLIFIYVFFFMAI